jgi:hypothetical protein
MGGGFVHPQSIVTDVTDVTKGLFAGEYGRKFW